METMLLLYMSAEDIRDKCIDCRCLALLAAISAAAGILRGDHSWMGLTAFVPGLLLCVLSYVTKEQLGSGDALLFLGMGFRLDPAWVIQSCQISFVLAGALALGILVRRYWGREPLLLKWRLWIEEVLRLPEPVEQEEGWSDLAFVPLVAISTGWLSLTSVLGIAGI